MCTTELVPLPSKLSGKCQCSVLNDSEDVPCTTKVAPLPSELSSKPEHSVSNDSEDDREEDGGDSEAIESDLELNLRNLKDSDSRLDEHKRMSYSWHMCTGLYRPNKLRRTYAMQDVTALFDDDELDSDGEQVEIANGDDSDAGREESDNEEPETMAMMLSDEVSDTCLLSKQGTDPVEGPFHCR